MIRWRISFQISVHFHHVITFSRPIVVLSDDRISSDSGSDSNVAKLSFSYIIFDAWNHGYRVRLLSKFVKSEISTVSCSRSIQAVNETHPINSNTLWTLKHARPELRICPSKFFYWAVKVRFRSSGVCLVATTSFLDNLQWCVTLKFRRRVLIRTICLQCFVRRLLCITTSDWSRTHFISTSFLS